MKDHHDLELPDSERTRCEIWTRVMGYHRPVAAWNPGKQSEHAERCYYREPGSADTPAPDASDGRPAGCTSIA